MQRSIPLTATTLIVLLSGVTSAQDIPKQRGGGAFGSGSSAEADDGPSSPDASPARETSPDLAAITERLKAARASQLAELTAERKAVAKERLPAREKRERLKEIDERIKNFASSPAEFPWIDPLNIRSGSVGKLPLHVEVLQILDEKKMLVIPYAEVLENTGGRRIGTQNFEFVSKPGEPIIIRNKSTAGIADGKQLRFSDVFYVAGTESYTAVNGAKKTVYVLDAIDAAVIADMLSEPEKPAHRTWTDDTGKHTIEAAFEKLEQGKVHLRKEDGSTAVLPLDKLSEADQQWVREEVKRRSGK